MEKEVPARLLSRFAVAVIVHTNVELRQFTLTPSGEPYRVAETEYPWLGAVAIESSSRIVK